MDPTAPTTPTPQVVNAQHYDAPPPPPPTPTVPLATPVSAPPEPPEPMTINANTVTINDEKPDVVVSSGGGAMNSAPKKKWGTGAIVGSLMAMVVLVLGAIVFGPRLLTQKTNEPTFAANCHCAPSNGHGSCNTTTESTIGNSTCDGQSGTPEHLGWANACCTNDGSEGAGGNAGGSTGGNHTGQVTCNNPTGGPCNTVDLRSCGGDGCWATCGSNHVWQVQTGTYAGCGQAGDRCDTSCAGNTCTGSTCTDNCNNVLQGTKNCSGGGGTTGGTTGGASPFDKKGVWGEYGTACVTTAGADPDQGATSAVCSGAGMIIYSCTPAEMTIASSGAPICLANGVAVTSATDCVAEANRLCKFIQIDVGTGVSASAVTCYPTQCTTTVSNPKSCNESCGGSNGNCVTGLNCNVSGHAGVCWADSCSPPQQPPKRNCNESCSAGDCNSGLSCGPSGHAGVCWADTCATSNPTPTPTTQSSFQCKSVIVQSVVRGGTAIVNPSLDKIQVGDVVTFRGFGTVVNTHISAIKFTLTKGGVAQAAVSKTAALSSGSTTQYQADYTITVDAATSYSVVSAPVSP